MPIAKKNDRGQPARTAQADPGRFFFAYPIRSISRDGSHIIYHGTSFTEAGAYFFNEN